MATKNEFRRSQGIVPYGIGSIVDFPEDSLMAAGLDAWPSELADPQTAAQIVQATEIVDGRLQRRLSIGRHPAIKRFLTPIEAPPRAGFGNLSGAASSYGFMPFVRFPQWHFCPRCRALHNVPWNAQVGDRKHLRCHGSIRLWKKSKGKPCAELTPDYMKPTLVPVRFAVACEAGHVMDFPWIKWVHTGNQSCSAGSGEIFIVSTGGAGLDGIKVECSVCKASRTMQGSFGRNPFQQIWPTCPGKRPWLGPDAGQPTCNKTPRTVQRGASNVYFANMTSSILIPPYSELLQQVLDRPDVWSLIESLPLVDGNLPEKPLHTIATNNGLDPNTFVQAVQERYSSDSDQELDPITEEEYRATEYDAYLGPRPPKSERHDFDIKKIDIAEYETKFQKYFENVVLITKHRETRVLTGFSRLLPPENLAQTLADLSLTKKDWLPAMEVRGEGIFLTLNSDELTSWVTENPKVLKKISTLNDRLSRVCQERGIPVRQITPKFEVIHTLAHLLIRQLSFDCGYDTSSLRERLYVDQVGDRAMSGLLIYTASGDSEGTLGGLVRQGIPGRLENTLWSALANSVLCSSDPLCIESQGQGVNSLNLAACHSCALLPETSCEEGNKLLDRGVLVGTPDEPISGFFSAEALLPV